jgi:hypothetical protein
MAARPFAATHGTDMERKGVGTRPWLFMDCMELLGEFRTLHRHNTKNKRSMSRAVRNKGEIDR